MGFLGVLDKETSTGTCTVVRCPGPDSVTNNSSATPEDGNSTERLVQVVEVPFHCVYTTKLSVYKE